MGYNNYKGRKIKMDSKVIKVNETDIKGMELKGNFLYEENG